MKKLVLYIPGKPAETLWEGEDEQGLVEAISDSFCEILPETDVHYARFPGSGRDIHDRCPTAYDLCDALANGETTLELLDGQGGKPVAVYLVV
jgi:hypothetical protein